MSARRVTWAGLVLVMSLALSACASWPEDCKGGFSERRDAVDPRLDMQAHRFADQRARGAELYAAGLVHETRTMFVRAQRNAFAGLQDDAERDLITIDGLLNAIETRLSSRR